jgi:hypothetical protein
MTTAITTTLPTGTRHRDAGASKVNFRARGMFGLVGAKGTDPALRFLLAAGSSSAARVPLSFDDEHLCRAGARPALRGTRNRGPHETVAPALSPFERCRRDGRLQPDPEGEPTRVLTKVNFDHARAKGASERGIQGLGAGLVTPFPGEALAACVPRASRIGRVPSGYGKDLAGSAQAHTRADASALRPQAARRGGRRPSPR